MNHRKRILLGQLGRRGDCLFATAVARQIKQDYPGCHLTWAIGSPSREVIEGNPLVDEIWELEQDQATDVWTSWNAFEQAAKKKKQDGVYDEVFLTQVHPGNFQNYDGTSRSSLFRGYPHPIQVPVQPMMRLSDQEIERVRAFVVENGIGDQDQVLIFECASTSGQSFVTPDFALDTARALLDRQAGLKVVVTSDQAIESGHENIIDGSWLSFRENAELTRYGDLLVGCSSGISWLATSDWAKPLPTIQLLSENTSMYASMIHDARYFELPTENILEMQECEPGDLADCIVTCLQEGFATAKTRYHREMPLRFDFFVHQLYYESLSKGEVGKTLSAIECAVERFAGAAEGQLSALVNEVLPPYIDLHWDRLDPQEQAEILAKTPYQPQVLPRPLMLLRSLALLSIKALTGRNTALARTLLKGVLEERLPLSRAEG